jgi:hypothetical protein
MPRFELGNTLVEVGTGVVGGGVQRMAWEASQMIGLFATGGLMLGGIVIQAMVDQPLLQQVGKAAAISGATVAGWVGAEKFLITGTPRTPLIAAQQRAFQEAENRRRALAGRGGADGLLARNAYAVVDERERTVL